MHFSQWVDLHFILWYTLKVLVVVSMSWNCRSMHCLRIVDSVFMKCRCTDMQCGCTVSTAYAMSMHYLCNVDALSIYACLLIYQQCIVCCHVWPGSRLNIERLRCRCIRASRRLRIWWWHDRTANWWCLAWRASGDNTNNTDCVDCACFVVKTKY